MRTLRIFEHISLDGIIAPAARKEGDDDYVHGGWTAGFRSVDGREFVVEAQGSGFDLLLGRRTYDLWSEYWPKAQKSPIADTFNAAKKYVATRRPESLTWGPAKGLGMDVAEGVRQVKASDGPNLILWGSSTITSLLLERGLVDEVVLFVYPVLLGSGIRFFSDTTSPQLLSLVSSKATSTGVQFNTYRYVSPLNGT
jgi:dihydrofolate reductase